MGFTMDCRIPALSSPKAGATTAQKRVLLGKAGAGFLGGGEVSLLVCRVDDSLLMEPGKCSLHSCTWILQPQLKISKLQKCQETHLCLGCASIASATLIWCHQPLSASSPLAPTARASKWKLSRNKDKNMSFVFFRVFKSHSPVGKELLIH